MSKTLWVVFLLGATNATAQLRDGRFHVFERIADCPATREEWMVVADELPVGGLNMFQLVTTGSACRDGCTFAEATADADALRTGARFLNVCCSDYAALRDRRTNTMSVARQNGAGQGVDQEIIRSGLCCETAAALAGVDMCGAGRGAAATTKVTAGTRLGCFRCPNSPYDLDGYLVRSNTNTPSSCIATCAAKGFAYAGVQYSQSCLCGNSYGKFGKATNCNMPCTGDRSKTCGGSYASTVYATGLGGPPPAMPQAPTPPSSPTAKPRSAAAGAAGIFQPPSK